MNTIDVIIPVYNSEKYLRRCLDSLQKQDICKEYCVYIIDDGSTDSSAEIAREYCEKNPEKFKYIYKANGGLSSSRNLGIDQSNSDYVVFVDSDDYVETSYLSSLYRLCTDNLAQISMCGMNRVPGDDGKGNRFNSGFFHNFVSDDIDKILLTSSFASCNKMYSRQVIGELRFPEGMTYEDFALIPQIMNRAKRIAYTHEILYHYYVNPNSIINSASKQKKTNRNILKAQHILEDSELKNKPGILENFYIRRVLSSMAWSIMEYNEGKEEVIKLVNEGFQKYPNMRSNPIISQESFPKKTFIRLILDKKFAWGEYWVRLYSLTRAVVVRLRGH